jgi:hypothetical protein
LENSSVRNVRMAVIFMEVAPHSAAVVTKGAPQIKFHDMS